MIIGRRISSYTLDTLTKVLENFFRDKQERIGIRQVEHEEAR